MTFEDVTLLLLRRRLRVPVMRPMCLGLIEKGEIDGNKSGFVD